MAVLSLLLVNPQPLGFCKRRVLLLGAFMPPLGGSFEPPLGPLRGPLWECQVRTVARAGTHTAEQDVWIGVKIGP